MGKNKLGHRNPLDQKRKKQEKLAKKRIKVNTSGLLERRKQVIAFLDGQNVQKEFNEKEYLESLDPTQKVTAINPDLISNHPELLDTLKAKKKVKNENPEQGDINQISAQQKLEIQGLSEQQIQSLSGDPANSAKLSNQQFRQQFLTQPNETNKQQTGQPMNAIMYNSNQYNQQFNPGQPQAQKAMSFQQFKSVQSQKQKQVKMDQFKKSYEQKQQQFQISQSNKLLNNRQFQQNYSHQSQQIQQNQKLPMPTNYVIEKGAQVNVPQQKQASQLFVPTSVLQKKNNSQNQKKPNMALGGEIKNVTNVPTPNSFLKVDNEQEQKQKLDSFLAQINQGL